MTYEDCCYERGIKWKVDEEGKKYRIAILSEQTVKLMKDVLKQQNEEFRKIFGRDMGPNDPIFFQEKYAGSIDEFKERVIKAMKEAKIRPSLIYAFKKTGLMLNTKTYDNAPTKDIQDWDDAIEEYYERVGLGESHLDEEEQHPLEEVQALLDEFQNCIMLLAYLCDQIKPGIIDTKDIVAVSSLTLSEFCFRKSEQNMKSIAKLIKDPSHMVDALNLTRSLYENYLTLVYTRKHPEKMAEIFDAKAGLKHGFYEYCKNKKGLIDKTRAREKESGKEVSLDISRKEMAKASDYEEDIEIHSYLYHYLSGYTHPDV